MDNFPQSATVTPKVDKFEPKTQHVNSQIVDHGDSKFDDFVPQIQNDDV